uniref:Trafficking protein particle complex subunit 11 n=1 Tax=Ornithodoros turicata TaxID=34597 RepID=A0A2R5LAW4_9ACAR
MKALEIGDLPEELTCRPKANVGFMGLDPQNNNIHSAVWQAFTSNRGPDRAPISFNLLPEKHQFPKPKPKHPSYEWYDERGILKTNWLHKHMVEVPAVVILFYDLDWDDQNWAEKRNDCAATLKALRGSVQSRNMKVALVLVQNSPSIPVGDSILATERAHSLCTACDLQPKSLFVLPYSDHLFGFILRLESAFLEIAQGYYTAQCKHIRAHKEFLNKNNHQLLLIRHQFKMAFMHELKQDPTSALRHYKQAYTNLCELKVTERNSLEVKTVAGFLNYKLCQLAFVLNVPLDAIHQFRKHIDYFRDHTGSPRLAFEHSVWLSKQFSHFGDLFEDAVQLGLTAIQTQHPGFYYQQAANNAMGRKEQAHKISTDMTSYPDPDPLEGMDSLEFYGQRPWQNNQSAKGECPDPQLEENGIKALLYREKLVDHSALVIPLLSSAVAQFKKYRCPRMKRHLMVQIAEEYYSNKEYDKALSILTHILWDYRTERWRPLVSDILTTGLKCAYLSASVPEFLMLGLEFISSWILGSQEDKSSVQTSVFNIIERKHPVAYPGLSESEVSSADVAWRNALSAPTEDQTHNLEMDHIVQSIECKVHFTQHSFSADQRVCLKVYLRSNCPLPIKATSLSVHFNTPRLKHYNDFCIVDDTCPGNSLHLVPRRTQAFSFAFLSKPCDVNTEIQVASVHLQLGSKEGFGLMLVWNVDKASLTSRAGLAWDRIPKRSFVGGEEIGFHQLPQLSSTRIHQRRACIRVDLDHKPPVLLHEFYPLSVKITSEEASPLTDVCLSLGLVDDLDPKYYSSTHFTCEDGDVPSQPTSKLHGFHVDDILPAEQRKQTILLRNSEIGIRRIFVKVAYKTDVEVDDQTLCCSCSKEIQMDLECIEPFTFSTSILNMKFETAESVRAEEQFIVQVDIASKCPLQLELVSGTLELAHHVTSVDKDVRSLVENVGLCNEEAARDLFCLVAPSAMETPTCLGKYTLQWKRKQSTTVAEHSVSLPTVAVQACPLLLELQAPAHGSVRTPLTVSYVVHNRTLLAQDIELFMDSSDSFMYSGNKQLHFRILPREQQMLTYNLYPLVSGYVPLPRMHIVINPNTVNASTLDALIGEMVPSHIFIMPQSKNGAQVASRQLPW